MANGYRFGFNGQEKDFDIAEGMYGAEFWEYDSRIGRRWNVDPVVDASVSGYACFIGNPIYFADPSGASVGEFLGKVWNTVKSFFKGSDDGGGDGGSDGGTGGNSKYQMGNGEFGPDDAICYGKRTSSSFGTALNNIWNSIKEIGKGFKCIFNDLIDPVILMHNWLQKHGNDIEIPKGHENIYNTNKEIINATDAPMQTTTSDNATGSILQAKNHPGVIWNNDNGMPGMMGVGENGGNVGIAFGHADAIGEAINGVINNVNSMLGASNSNTVQEKVNASCGQIHGNSNENNDAIFNSDSSEIKYINNLKPDTEVYQEIVGNKGHYQRVK